MNRYSLHSTVTLFMSLMITCTAMLATPPLLFREQTAEEAFETVLYFGAKAEAMAQFELTLPQHPALNNFYDTQTITPEEQEQLRPIFYTEIFPTLASPYSQETIRELFEQPIEQVVEKLLTLNNNWGFYLPEQYEFRLSASFGVRGGPYNATKGYTAYALYQAPTYQDVETLVSIMIMMGLEEPIVKKYNLTFWEKRRLTVLIEKLYLQEFNLLPKNGKDSTDEHDIRIDQFITLYNIEHNLPAAIEQYIAHYPRKITR